MRIGSRQCVHALMGRLHGKILFIFIDAPIRARIEGQPGRYDLRSATGFFFDLAGSSKDTAAGAANNGIGFFKVRHEADCCLPVPGIRTGARSSRRIGVPLRRCG